jgi:hypothetical protein
MKNYKKGSASLILIIIILILIGLCLYLYYSKSPVSKTVVDTTNQQVNSSVDKSNVSLDLDVDLLNSELGETETSSYLVDLNNDKHADLLLRPVGSMMCGTGGCPLYVFKNTGNGFDLVSVISITKSVSLAKTYTNGWRDIVIGYSGGGGPSGLSKMTFNGKSYPSNPTTEGTKVTSSNNLEEVF